jgi:DNA-binding MarR family transcriptional regulator
MDRITQEQIENVRRFNRVYTNVMGYIDRHVLETEYTLSEGRLLHEIGKVAPCTLKRLSDTLRMDPGYLSRIVKKFETEGLLEKKRSAEDGRAVLLCLTKRGNEAVDAVNKASSLQIEQLLRKLGEEERTEFLSAMRTVERILNEEGEEER